MTDELLELTCPYCDVIIFVPGDAWVHTCNNCGEKLTLDSQFAYLRGLDAFKEGQEIFQETNPRKRQKFREVDREALEIFMQAYSSLQVAMKYELEETQRVLAVEMMNSMTQEFSRRLMVSPLEVSYWNTIMVEQTAQIEYDHLKKNLLEKSTGLLDKLKRWRWVSRQKKLLQTLPKLDAKLKALEEQIDFIDIPHARNKKWKP